MERAAVWQIQPHLESNSILDDFQSGFRPGRGPETALTKVQDDLLWALDRNEASALVLLDLSAAFDTIDHSRLLDRLGTVAGIDGIALAWMTSFLLDRVQRVRLGLHCSSDSPLSCGVPQGSALSPLLFNIYMRPLLYIIRRHNLSFHVYADDTQFYIPLPRDGGAQITLATCLEEIQAWMGANYLMLNGSKTECMVLCNQPWSGGFPTWPDSFSSVPVPVTQVRDLGIILDERLTLRPQVNQVVSSCHFHLKLLRSTFRFIEESHKISMVNAIIGSRLDYCNALYLGLPNNIMHKLQLIQNAAARLLTGVGRRDHITPSLRALHWLPVKERVLFKTGCMVHRATHGKGPVYLQEKFTKYVPNRTLRSANLETLVIPKFRKKKCGGRTSAVQGAQFWNSLPLKLRLENDLFKFRKLLKTELFSLAYGIT